jgi:nucleoid DNA-binding protein
MSDALTKTKLAAALRREARFKTIPKDMMVDILETALDLIVCHITETGGKVILRGFGAFKARVRHAFTGTDPRTGEPLEIGEKYSISFKPSAEVIQRLNF